MRNQFTEFKTLLKILPLQGQIIEIDEKINEVRNEKIRIVRLTYLSLSVIKELKHMKQIALNSLNNKNIISQQ